MGHKNGLISWPALACSGTVLTKFLEKTWPVPSSRNGTQQRGSQMPWRGSTVGTTRFRITLSTPSGRQLGLDILLSSSGKTPKGWELEWPKRMGLCTWLLTTIHQETL